MSEAIKGRRSIRKYCDKPVPRDMLDQILESAKAAPSAGNLQARDFFVVTDSETKQHLVNAAMGQKFIAQADIVVVVCANSDEIDSYGQRGIELYMIQDSAASVQNMLLTAYSLGLGTCWVGAFDESIVIEAMKLPKHFRPVAIIPIGWPDQSCRERSKRDDDVHFVR